VNASSKDEEHQQSQSATTLMVIQDNVGTIHDHDVNNMETTMMGVSTTRDASEQNQSFGQHDIVEPNKRRLSA